MTDQVSRVGSDVDNLRTVETLLAALQEPDFDALDSVLADDVVWTNVGLLTLRGRQRIVKLLRPMEGRLGLEIKVHRVAADGSVVMTERTDAMVIGPVRLQFWVCGVFEVHEGRITLWRDYFDMFDFFVKAPLRAIAGLVLPPLKPKFQ
jgi:limonene-1,2-epoxide hydrolase